MNIRNLPNTNFTIVRNAAMDDPRLSWKAKGLLVYMRTRPERWTFHLNHLITVSTDGRDATRAALRELEEAGYLARYRTRDEATQAWTGWEWIVSDDPEAVAAVLRETRSTAHRSDGDPATSKTEGSKTENYQDEHLNQKHVEPRELLSAPPTNGTRLTPRRSFDHQVFMDAWNDGCGMLPRISTLNDKRRKAIDRFIRDFTSPTEAVAAFGLAVANVAADPWWREHGYGFDNLTVTGRVLERAEKQAELLRADERNRSARERHRRDLDAQADAIFGTNGARA
jgi:hypothetical protein